MKVWKSNVLNFTVTTFPLLHCCFILFDNASHRFQKIGRKLSRPVTSVPKVVSVDMLLTDETGLTFRKSIPWEKVASCWPIWPYLLTNTEASFFWRSFIFTIPSFFNFVWSLFPTPIIIPIGRSDRNCRASFSPIRLNPFGLFRSEATLARNLL